MSLVVPSFSLKFSFLTQNALSIRFFKIITSKHAIKLNSFGIKTTNGEVLFEDTTCKNTSGNPHSAKNFTQNRSLITQSTNLQ